MDSQKNPPPNHWKTAALAIGASVAILAGAGTVIAMMDDTKPPASVAQPEATQPPSGPVTPAPVAQAPATMARADTATEDCDRYLAGTQRDNSGVIKDGLVGGAIGAGLGAAGGAIADGGDGAKKGAGIGGLIGGVASTLSSNEQERERVEAARAAYERCRAHNL